MELSTGFLIIVTFSPVIYGERNYYTDGDTLSSANVQQTDVVLCGGGGGLLSHVSKFPQLSNMVFDDQTHLDPPCCQTLLPLLPFPRRIRQAPQPGEGASHLRARHRSHCRCVQWRSIRDTERYRLCGSRYTHRPLPRQLGRATSTADGAPPIPTLPTHQINIWKALFRPPAAKVTFKRSNVVVFQFHYYWLGSRGEIYIYI